MASDGPSLLLPPVVILDANLLYPFHLRNLLVQFGVDAIIAPRWTTRIQEEWIGNLVAAGSRSSTLFADYVDALRRQGLTQLAAHLGE